MLGTQQPCWHTGYHCWGAHIPASGWLQGGGKPRYRSAAMPLTAWAEQLVDATREQSLCWVQARSGPWMTLAAIPAQSGVPSHPPQAMAWHISPVGWFERLLHAAGTPRVDNNKAPLRVWRRMLMLTT